MENFFKDFKSQINERLSNPLLGSFLISWVIWNWGLVLGLLFGNGYSERLLIVQAAIKESEVYYFKLWAYPLLSAGLYITFYPFLARLVYWYWENQQKKLKGMRQSIEDEMPITQEEAIRLRRFNRDRLRDLETQIEEWQRRYQDVQKRLAERDDDCEKLDSERESLIEEILTLKSKLPNEDPKQGSNKVSIGSLSSEIYERFSEQAIAAAKSAIPFDDEQPFVTLLAFINSPNGTAQDVAEASGLSKIYVDYGVDRLIDRGILEKASGGRLRFTERGRMLVIKSGLVVA